MASPIYNPNVIESYDIKAPIDGIFITHMEKSIKRFNLNYDFADFDYVHMPRVDVDIISYSYYVNKQPTTTSKTETTTTTSSTETTQIITTTTITPAPIKKKYLRYNIDNDTWKDITSTFQMIYDDRRQQRFQQRDLSEHGWW